MITDSEFSSWLKDQSASRVILVEASVKTSGGATVTRYLSNRGYTTKPSDTPSNTSYIARISGGVRFTQSMSIDGSVSISFGDIELNNQDGFLDEWIDDFWNNRQIDIYIGDSSWARGDFRKAVSGTMVGVSTRNRNTLNIKLSDKLQRLNNPVTEETIGGTTKLATMFTPLCFGECHNVEPVLVEPFLQKYKVHTGLIENIIEVRDNGVPVAFNPFLSEGAFTLTKAPAGQITCSVQGAKFSFLGGSTEWHNTVATIVYHLATSYGSTTLRFSPSDFNSVKMSNFNAANMQPVGLYVRERANLFDLINKVAGSIGARLVVDGSGLASLVKLDAVGFGDVLSISNKDIIERSLEVEMFPDVVASVKIGYCKNYTVQENLETGIVPEHSALFAEEWLTALSEDNVVAADYNLFTEPVISETLLLREVDATAEATRRLNIFKQRRKVLKIQCPYHFLTAELGQSVSLQANRFGLNSGKQGQILSISTDFVKPIVDINILV